MFELKNKFLAVQKGQNTTRMDTYLLAEQIKTQAQALGFTQAAIAPATPDPHQSYYQAWLEAGYQAEMGYLARPEAIARRANLALTVPGAQSVVVVAAGYHTGHLPAEIMNDPSRGIIAGYAWGVDYHHLLTPRLHALQQWIEAQAGVPVNGRAYVDTGPVLERSLSAQAGLGFIGKNTCLINARRGSFFFLGEIILDLALPVDYPLTGPGCGRCSRCLSACPTEALTGPYRLDNRRCISYLTIELKGEIPPELRPLMGNRIFGCDICQDVCPYNRKFAMPATDPAFRGSMETMAPPLLDLISLDEAGFERRFGNSPLKRAKRRGLLRNVCVALGNWGSAEAIRALQIARLDPEPLIRNHAEWALK